MPFRYGGEEFILIHPETDITAARTCGERLREAVHAMQIQHYGQKLEGVTLSVGIACYPEHGSSSDVLVRGADLALYRAKEKGRYQVVLADDL